MKKSNVTLIAAALIAIHVLIALALLGTGNKKPKNRPAPSPVPAQPEAIVPESESPEFKIPELNLPTPFETAMPAEMATPVEVVEMKPAQPRETIAAPINREGYLRSDRPNRRTSKVYANLVAEPYRSAIVVDARTGKILFEDKADRHAYPASVTKMMTMLIVLEQIDAGIIGLNDNVQITKEIAGIGGSGVYLDVRESGAFTVQNMLEALTIHSANDAAAALAVHVAGSRAAFVDMMNQKARELGMNSTRYHSEHGLPPEGGAQPDISTAYDIALLSLACLRHPETLGYTGTKLSWLPLSPIRKEKFMLANRNALVGKAPYSGCDGLKTGYHSKGGWSLAATAERNGKRIVSVTLGSPSKTVRNATARKLLDKGFQALAH
jgi:D-alanyl-D-alanine carboxypeptidase (penicillin-binding protein 5/6)